MKPAGQLALLVALLAAPLYARAQEAAPRQLTDAARERLTGPVRSVRSERQELIEDGAGRDAKAQPRRQSLGEMAFDETGWMTRRTVYDDYGYLVGTEVYARDERGRLTSAVLTDEKGNVVTRDTYAYDTGSKLSETVSFEHYPEQQPVTIKTAYVYDAAGRRAQEVYAYQDRPSGRTVYTYDARGNATDVAFFASDGEKAFAPVGPCFSVHRLVSVYDDKGRIVEQSAYEPDGTLKRKATYAYDERGNLAAETLQDGYGSISRTHAYELDARGNWVSQKIVTTNRSFISGSTGTRAALLTRTITYY